MHKHRRARTQVTYYKENLSSTVLPVLMCLLIAFAGALLSAAALPAACCLLPVAA